MLKVLNSGCFGATAKSPKNAVSRHPDPGIDQITTGISHDEGHNTQHLPVKDMCHGPNFLYWGWSSHPFIGNPYTGYRNPPDWDDHPLLYGNNGT